MLANLLEYGPAAFLYLLAMAAQVSGYTSALVAIALAGLGTVWLAGYQLHKWHRTRLNKGKRSVEPSHLIMFGLIGAAFCLIVAASGYIWQTYQPSKELASIQEPTSPAHSGFSVKPRYLSSAQKDALADALGTISSVINTQGKNAVTVTSNIKVFGSPDRKNMQLAIRQFSESHDLAKSVYIAIYGDDGVLKKNPDFPELAAIVEYTSVVERFQNMARDISDVLIMIDQNYERVIDPSKFALLISPHHLRTSQDTTALNDWITTVNERIALTRAALLK